MIICILYNVPQQREYFKFSPGNGLCYVTTFEQCIDVIAAAILASTHSL